MGMIEDIPCRFKYREVAPNDYGITPEEILISKDSTLRQFVSMKKMAPYQPTQQHSDNSNDVLDYNPGSKKRQKFRDMLKDDYEDYLSKEQELQSTKNQMKKDSGNLDTETDNTDTHASKKKRRRRQKKKSHKDGINTSSNGKKTTESEVNNQTHDQITKPPIKSAEEATTKETTNDKVSKRKRHKSKTKEKLSKSSSSSTDKHDLSVSRPKKKKSSRKAKHKSLENGVHVSSSRLASYGL